MKNYTNNNPTFLNNVAILETTDTNHAENFNESTKRLMDNTLALKNEILEVREEANELVDDTTGVTVKMGIDNGLLYLETVNENASI